MIAGPLKGATVRRSAYFVLATAIINSQAEVGGWPGLQTGAAPRDGDGMPDEWERQCGLNPDNPVDGPQDRDGDGYTNVEEYLNELVG
jgi:hypothetical protein